MEIKKTICRAVESGQLEKRLLLAAHDSEVNMARKSEKESKDI